MCRKLVDMFCPMGMPATLQCVCVKHGIHNVIFPNAIVAGILYKAQQKFRQRNHETYHVSTRRDITLVASLHSCSNAQRGEGLHASIVQSGLNEKHFCVRNTSVDMHPMCGAVLKVHNMSDELPIQNAVPWNALISEYAQRGYVDKAIACIRQMHCEGLSLSAPTYICILKKCASVGAMDNGQLVHAQLDKIGLLSKDAIVGTALVDMYAKCGAFVKAQDVFHKLPVQDVVAWNALIAGYVQHGLGEEALMCFEKMQHTGLFPNTITFACILKACGSIAAAVKGQEVHARVVRGHLLEKTIVVANALADMYAKCGFFERAQQVFDELVVRDVVSWNTLITAFTQRKHGDEALKCFERMQCEGLFPSIVTFACILKACGSVGALGKGHEVHARIHQEAVWEKRKVVANALLDMYVKCGSLDMAQVVFDTLPLQDVVSWTVLIGGYVQYDYGEKALMYFERMQCESCSPNAVTFVCVLKACGSLGALDKAIRVHAQLVEGGLFEEDTVVANALVDTYVKCGSLAKAHEVFNKLPVPDLIAWNALISGYAQEGCGEEALNHFEAMQCAGLSPDAFTYACVLKACGSLGAACEGQEIHAEIVRDGLLEKDTVVANALVDMFAKCGMLAEAQEVFDELLVWDVVSWNSLIAGYAQHGHADEALSCFEQMRGDGFLPDVFTYASIFKVCGGIGAACKGQKIHDEIARGGLLETDMVLSVALVDMYAKFAMLAEAQDVFNELPVEDVASLNALLAGYAQLGEDESVANACKKLIEGGKVPDWAMFTIVLNACSHGGLLHDGQMYFEIMNTVYGTVLTVEQYACMIDLLGRAGHLDKAVILIMEMPFHANLTIWLSLLAACRKWGNMKLGKWAFENVVELDENNTAAYVCMCNIYAGADMEEDDNMIDSMGASEQTWKHPRHDWLIDASETMQSIASEYKNRAHGHITSKQENVAKKIAQEAISNLRQVSRDIVSETNKHHKHLVMASALSDTPNGTPICVSKDRCHMGQETGTRSGGWQRSKMTIPCDYGVCTMGERGNMGRGYATIPPSPGLKVVIPSAYAKDRPVCGDCYSTSSTVVNIDKCQVLTNDVNTFHFWKEGNCYCGKHPSDIAIDMHSNIETRFSLEKPQNPETFQKPLRDPSKMAFLKIKN